MIGRRTLMAGFAVMPWCPGRATAQTAPPRIAALGLSASPNLHRLEKSLRDAGLVPGQNVVIDASDDEGDYRRYPALVAEALRNRPALFIVQTIAAAEAARAGVPTVPIVMIGINDPVGVGLAASLARPGGMITGVATSSEDLVTKLIALTMEALPTARTFAALYNPLNPTGPKMLDTVAQAVGPAAGRIVPIALPAPADVEGLSERLAAEKADVAVLLPDFALSRLSGPIVRATNAARVPLTASLQLFAAAGALLVYSYDPEFITRRAVDYVKRILAGAKPADLPIERPVRYTLAVNMVAARALGLQIPLHIIARADEVID